MESVGNVLGEIIWHYDTVPNNESRANNGLTTNRSMLLRRELKNIFCSPPAALSPRLFFSPSPFSRDEMNWKTGLSPALNLRPFTSIC